MTATKRVRVVNGNFALRASVPAMQGGRPRRRGPLHQIEFQLFNEGRDRKLELRNSGCFEGDAEIHDGRAGSQVPSSMAVLRARGPGAAAP